MLIEINLLPGAKKKRAAAPGITLPDLGALVARVKDPLLIGAVASWVVAPAAIGYLFVTESGRRSALEDEFAALETEARRFQTLLNEKRRAERLRDSLATELQVIREIDGDRYVWPHILDEVARALPDYTWLDSLAVAPAPFGGAADTLPPPVRFRLDGRTSEIAAYTGFVRRLANSPWIGELEPGATRLVMEEGKALTAFSITGVFRQADSAYIQTVPLQESVR